jgi:hemin uptake protein HemP
MSRIVTVFALLLALLLASSLNSYGADSAVKVQLDSTKAGPRSVESLTEQVILRDYRFAWTSIAQGEAKQWLSQTVTNQQRSSLSQRYVDQNHKVQAMFYAPEGDVIELHDTAEYQLQILDGGKLIHEEHVVVHYVVLMTPAADRWVIRHLQAVPQF